MSDFDYPHRRSTRLKGYDYRQNGAYFVTICTHNKACLFGSIHEGTMTVNVWGAIVQEEWMRCEAVRPYILLDAFIVMPNHMHGIVVITDEQDIRASSTLAAHSLGAMIGQFKASVTKRIRAIATVNDDPRVWQRNYYDHIIRNEKELDVIRTYVATNAERWVDDVFYS